MGLQVIDVMYMKDTAKEKPFSFVRPALSFIFKEVDKVLPEEMDATHRVANPKSEASLALEKAFKREERVKVKNLVVDCAYVRQGDVM